MRNSTLVKPIACGQNDAAPCYPSALTVHSFGNWNPLPSAHLLTMRERTENDIMTQKILLIQGVVLSSIKRVYNQMRGSSFDGCIPPLRQVLKAEPSTIPSGFQRNNVGQHHGLEAAPAEPPRLLAVVVVLVALGPELILLNHRARKFLVNEPR